MINQEFDIVPVFRSVRKLRPGAMVKHKVTGQFGVVSSRTLRGANSRRNLRDSFEPISLYLVDSQSIPEEEDSVIVSYKTGETAKGKMHEFPKGSYDRAMKIILYPSQLLEAQVTVDGKTYLPFKLLTVRTVNTLLSIGGKVLMIVNDANEPITFEGKPQIFLNNKSHISMVTQ